MLPNKSTNALTTPPVFHAASFSPSDSRPSSSCGFSNPTIAPGDDRNKEVVRFKMAIVVASSGVRVSFSFLAIPFLGTPEGIALE